MTLNDYQNEALKFATYKNNLYPVLALAEEAGEVLGKFAKGFRGDTDNIDQLAVAKELGDVLWQLSACTKEIGLTLEEVAQLNLMKLTDRANRDVIQGTGDER
jgi:NTP pyrophosphatase (non-canonical NTP hydrolase)